MSRNDNDKVLLKLDNKIQLTKYGYNIHKSDNDRHKALSSAVNDNGALLILRKLELTKEYQNVKKNKKILLKDIEYVEHLQKNLKQQHGGSATVIDQQKYCVDGNCQTENSVYELHVVGDKHIEFMTLDKSDADQILQLDRLYLDSDMDIDTVRHNIMDNTGLLIGIKINDLLEGYCQYNPLEDDNVAIVWFCANTGNGSLLYKFMERYFIINDYTRIKIVVSLEGSYATKRINFWYKMNFQTYEANPDKKKLYMIKNIQNMDN